ncbi:transposase [Streptomyces sp. NRRL S-118]|uniref:transposase n=1 Tax=Streptomyces sp. NRRL S-118 TaxID=1463881 RepID=UPI000D146EF9
METGHGAVRSGASKARTQPGRCTTTRPRPSRPTACNCESRTVFVRRHVQGNRGASGARWAVGDLSAGCSHASSASTGRSRRPADDRAVLAAIIWVATTGCTWRRLPPVFGTSWQMVHRRCTTTLDDAGTRMLTTRGLERPPPAGAAACPSGISHGTCGASPLAFMPDRRPLRSPRPLRRSPVSGRRRGRRRA